MLKDQPVPCTTQPRDASYLMGFSDVYICIFLFVPLRGSCLGGTGSGGRGSATRLQRWIQSTIYNLRLTNEFWIFNFRLTIRFLRVARSLMRSLCLKFLSAKAVSAEGSINEVQSAAKLIRSSLINSQCFPLRHFGSKSSSARWKSVRFLIIKSLSCEYA